MFPLNHKRTTSSLAPPIICVANKIGNKKIEGSPLASWSRKLYDFATSTTSSDTATTARKGLNSHFFAQRSIEVSRRCGFAKTIFRVLCLFFKHSYTSASAPIYQNVEK